MCPVDGQALPKQAMKVSSPTAGALQDTSAAASTRTFCWAWRCQPPSHSQGWRLLIYRGASSHYSGGSVVRR